MYKSKSRLLWDCRRGMLELDVLLKPFAEEVYDELSDADKSIFERLLGCDDPDLFSWFMKRRECPDAELVQMMNVILSHNKI